MHAGKTEIAAKTAVCGASGSISGAADKIREKRALSHCAAKNAVPPKTTRGHLFNKI